MAIITPDMRQQLIDMAVAEVMSNENMRKVFKRYGVTNSMQTQINMAFARLCLEAERPGP